MKRLGSLDLSVRPAVVVALRDGVAREEIDAAITSGAGAVELRIDEFSDTSEAHVLAECKRLSGIPLLATIRSAAEGGAWDGDEAARLDLFKAVIPAVDAVDIELSSLEIRDAVIRAARDAGKLVIGSFHDFEETPPDTALAALAVDAQTARVDVLKVAVRCNTQGDLRRLTRFTVDHAESGCVVVGMGPLGMATRVFFPLLGSLLTYTFLGEPTAPGQLNCADTLRYLNAFQSEAD